MKGHSRFRAPRGLAVALALACWTSGPLAAQSTGTIEGTVTTAQGEPLRGVQVSVEGTQRGALTGEGGQFRITGVQAGTREVRAQRVGYRTESLTVSVGAGATTSADFTLRQAVIDLGEVVVTGVAGATQRSHLPFTVGRVDAEQLPVPAVSAGAAIQGKVAGAQVVQGSGRPGAAPSILLRGATSIDASGRSQDPLYIVDGVILSGDMSDISALDIESIEVVKGAAAASLYGSRAANGVVQITTRRGTGVADNQVRYSARSEVGRSELANRPRALISQRHRYLMTEDGTQFMGSDGEPCDWLQCSGLVWAGQTAGDGEGVGAWNTFQSNPWPQTFDHLSTFFNPGAFAQHHVTAEGRTGPTNFHVGYSRLREEGILPGQTGLGRHNVRLNLDQSVLDNVTVSASAFYSRSESDLFPETNGNPMFDLTRMPAGADLRTENEDGELVLLIDPTNRESPNPLYTMLNRRYTEDRDRFLGSATLRVSPLAWLDLDGSVSYDRITRDHRDLFPKGFRTIDPNTNLNDGQMYRLKHSDDALNAEVTGTMRFDLTPDLRNTTRVRYLYEQQETEWNWTQGYAFLVADVPTFANMDPTRLSANSSYQPIRADGYFAITNFIFRDRYIFDGLIRNDGSSLFGPDERRQWYYRLAGAYRMAEEPWFNVPAIDELRLRYSYGTAGGRPRFDAQYETFSVVGGSVSPVTLGNRALKPEHSQEHEAGVELGFLNGRAVLDVVHARTDTRDQILPVPLQATAGYSTQWQNVGTLSSNTWEVSLDGMLVQTPDFRWSGRVLFDRTRSTITEMPIPAFQFGVPGQRLEDVFYAREGEVFGTFYGVKVATSCADLPSDVSCDGFTVNDDGLLVWTGGQPLSANNWGEESGLFIGRNVFWGAPVQGVCTDRVTGEETFFCPVGNSTPDYSISLANTLQWRGLSLYALLDAVQGFDVYNQPLQWNVFAGQAGIFDQDGPIEQQKPVGYYDGMYAIGGLQPSSLFVEDGSFVKLREIALRYQLAEGRLPVPGVSGAAFTLTGRNLHTWTNYRGYDPEVGKAGGDTGSSALARVEGYQYPNFRTFTLGVELNF